MSDENNTPIGESEHDKAMMEVAAKNRAARSGEAPAEEEVAPTEEEGSELLLGKFKTPEDLAKAYTELEKKLGKPSTEEESTDEEDASTEEDTSTEEDDSAEEGGLDFEAFTKELHENGELSEASKAAIKKAGIPDSVRDAYIQSETSKSSEAVNKFIETAGSEEALQKTLEWAGDHGDKALNASYEYARQAGDFETMHQIFERITQDYKKANGYEGKEVSGVPTSSKGDVFESQRQMIDAMSDPRYVGPKADPAYIAEVERKLMRTRQRSG